MKKVLIIVFITILMLVLAFKAAVFFYRKHRDNETIAILEQECGAKIPSWKQLKIDYSFEFCVSGKIVFKEYPSDLEKSLKFKPIRETESIIWLQRYNLEKERFQNVTSLSGYEFVYGSGKKWGWELALEPASKTLWFVWGFPISETPQSGRG